MNIAQQPFTIFANQAKAVELVTKIQKDDFDWTYRVIEQLTVSGERWVISVKDASGYFIGYL